MKQKYLSFSYFLTVVTIQFECIVRNDYKLTI